MSPDSASWELHQYSRRMCMPMKNPGDETRSWDSNSGPHACKADALPHDHGHHTKYYAQVQGEMAVMCLPWCDFVNWTAAPQNNMFIDRVYFDTDFVNYMLPKLVEFYAKHVFPVLDCNVKQ